MESQKYYITTPIYYVNDVAHIGHAYTTIIADTLARYKRLLGYDVYFLTGTDEHGQKIAQSAEKKGKTPKEYADEISGAFRKLWDDFGISYDQFIRTTDSKHISGVQHAFEKMFQKGDIYKGEYEGYYCVACEAFFTKKQLLDDEYCPECGKDVQLIREESYFFKLSQYEEKLLGWYKNEPDCILPKAKKNEVINFVKEGLKDLSITRTSFEWGVKLPESINDPKHVMYVWLDALLNYATALGYGGDEKHMQFWPATTHLVGKDILRFHAIYWPAFLMSLGMPLPKQIAAHGWWTRNGAKMSKSIGNVVNPREVADAYGLENFRYFMLREVPFGYDGDFSQKALIDRINSDLGNDLGNLLNRIIGMSGKYFEGKIDSKMVRDVHLKELDDAMQSINAASGYIYDMQLNRYLEELWKPLTVANKAIDQYQPWTLMKEGKESEAMALIALIANILAKISIMLFPVMPETCYKIAKALGIVIDHASYKKYIVENALLDTFVIEKIPPLFPRIEEQVLKDVSDPQSIDSPKKEEKKEDSEEKIGLITIDEFFATSLKIGTIIEAEEIPKSSKLLKLQIELGEAKPRQVLAGIKEFYHPDELVQTQVCVVANLRPAKLMGHESQGMVLAARDERGLVLIRPERKKQNGTAVK